MKTTLWPRGRKGLTRKQKAFAQALLEDKKKPAVQAALETYGSKGKPTTYMTADTIARANLENPRILKYLNDHAEKAELTMIKIMNDSYDKIDESPAYAAVSKSAASDILDRVHGKATQRQELVSTKVVISIDLTQAADSD